jgi:hypothetical protein
MEKRSQVKVAMTYGAISGLAASIAYLIFYFGGAAIDNKWPQYLGWIILFVAIILGIKTYRDQDSGGYITYSRSLGTGVLIGIFSGIITGFFTVLMFTVIDPGLVDKIIEQAQQDMIERGSSETEMEIAMTWTRKFMNPGMLFIFSMLGSAFLSFLFSLIISIFTRKEPPVFKG